MLQLTPQSAIFIAGAPVDFRKGIDSLVAVCKQNFAIDPLGGALFIFYNRLMTSIKVLSYDGQGFWLCIKRLSSGKFQWKPHAHTPIQKICYRSLHIILANGNPDLANIAKNWRKIKA